jgi:hypothetical protein
MTDSPSSQSPARKPPAKRQKPSKAVTTHEEGEAPPLGAAMMPQARLNRNTAPPKARLTANLKACIELMAHQGISIEKATADLGINLEATKRAFRKNHVKQAYNQLVAEIRSGAAVRAFLRVNHLGEAANSETVRLEANKWVAGVGDIAPIRRVEGRHSHHVSFAGFDMDLNPLDITPDDDA